jgi:Na+/melibiose symporter-like transporter
MATLYSAAASPVAARTPPPGERARTPLRLAAFSAIALPIMGALLPLQIFVPQYYAATFGLSLPAIGLVFLVIRLIDAASDPIAGLLSDATRTRFGRRRPWIAAGGVLLAVGSWLLYFPPENPSLAYLVVAVLLVSVSYTMVWTPFSAWAGELSRDYHERTRVMSYQMLMYALGLLVIQLMPTVIDQLVRDDGHVKMVAIGALTLALLVPALALTLTTFDEPPAPARPRHREPVGRTARIVLGDGLLLRVLASDLSVRTGQGVRGALMIFFMIYYMRLPQWAFGLFFVQYVFGLAAAPIWLRIGTRLGKHRAAILGELVQVAINLALLAVFPGGFALLLALTVAQGLAQSSGNLMLRAMVGDLADRHLLRTGTDRTGLFYSVFSLSEKAGGALSIGIALPLVAWLGFAPKSHNGGETLEHLKYVFALGPAIAHIVSAALLIRFPLDAAAHARIRAALATREPTPSHA